MKREAATSRVSAGSLSAKFLLTDDSAIAQRTAEHLGIEFKSIHMNEAKLAESFEDAVWHCEHVRHRRNAADSMLILIFQYFSDLNVIGKYALSRITTEAGVKTVLTGE